MDAVWDCKSDESKDEEGVILDAKIGRVIVTNGEFAV